jgi:CheY-like chemotaxis protein
MTDSAMQLLPELRRHARMLLGRQDAADDAVAAALKEQFDQRSARDADELRKALLGALYRVLARRGHIDIGPVDSRELQPRRSVDVRLRSLSFAQRAALLLISVERLSLESAASILDVGLSEALDLADQAQEAIERDLETTVLIIEDEWALARDLEQIIVDLGHRVSAVAANERDAIDLASRHQPGLLLADINLADGGSGLDAVRAIGAAKPTPTVFVTEFPERLLQASQPRLTYIITKPFSPMMIKATVNQALFFS